MGACFNSIEFPGELAAGELQKRFSQYCEEQEYEHGHSPYNGTLSTTCGLRVEQTTFPSRKEAEDYICDNTNKRGSSIAVRYKVVERVTKKEPTFGGKTIKDIGFQTHKSVATIWTREGSKATPADQLSPEDKEKITSLHALWKEAERAQNQLAQEMRSLLNRLQRVEEDFTEEDFKKLKRVRRELRKATESQASLAERFRKLDERLGKGIWKVESRENGTRWIVGGWAAE